MKQEPIQVLDGCMVQWTNDEWSLFSHNLYNNLTRSAAVVEIN
jgi:hypothetical protein